MKKSTVHETNLKRSYLGVGCSGAVFALEHFSQQVTCKTSWHFVRLKKMAIAAKSLPGLQVDFWDEDQRAADEDIKRYLKIEAK